MKERAIFFDRDGTLNVEKNYLHSPAEWEWIPGAVDSLVLAREKGFRLIVVTNQSGVQRGYYSEEAVRSLHRWVQEGLQARGVFVDGFYYCPHGESDGCSCRKPRPGMLLQACQDHHIDPHRSYLIGDRTTDVDAARSSGVRPVLVLTGYGEHEKNRVGADVPVVADVLSAVRLIVEEKETAP